MCDDDFNEDAAKVVCRYLGFKGRASIRKDGYYGKGTGPIWLDQIYCFGNESKLHECDHWDFGVHNCDHDEDVGVVCGSDSNEAMDERKSKVTEVTPRPQPLVPSTCGLRKDNLFFKNDEEIQFRVVQAAVAKVGYYPWQVMNQFYIQLEFSDPKSVFRLFYGSRAPRNQRIGAALS